MAEAEVAKAPAPVEEIKTTNGDDAASVKPDQINGTAPTVSDIKPSTTDGAETNTDNKPTADVSKPETSSPSNDRKRKPSRSPSRSRSRSPTTKNERDWRERRKEDIERDRRSGRDRSDRYRGEGHRSSRGGRGGVGRGRGRGGPRTNYRENIKSRYEDLPETDDADEIRKQVEFYFSDSNLPADKFLLQQVGGSKNVAVPLKTLHSFKRMRRFQPYSAVVAALRESEMLDVVSEGREEGEEEIKRKVPLKEGITDDPELNVELVEDAARPRSIYAKGFGEEKPSTQFDIEAFFAPYGPINAIRLRRQFPEKTFKGSVFVEFDSEGTAQAFLELENKPKWEDKELKVMSKEQYVKSKAKDVKEGKIRGSTYESRGRGRGRGRGDRGRGRGDRRDGRDSGGRRDRDDSRSRHRRSTSEDERRPKKEDVDKEDFRAGAEQNVKAEEGANGKPDEKPADAESRGEDKAEKDAAAPEAEVSKKRSREDTDGAGGAEDEQKQAKKAKVEGEA